MKPDKIIQIAKNITKDYNKIAYSIPLKTKNGIKNITIHSIKIIIETDGLPIKSTKTSAKRKRIINEQNGPKYPLSDIQSILSHMPINIEFHPRPKAQPENLGISKEDAINIIKSLQPSEYKETSHKSSDQAADVYLAVRTILKEEIKIYIKFYIKNTVGVFVISFHESENE